MGATLTPQEKARVQAPTDERCRCLRCLSACPRVSRRAAASRGGWDSVISGGREVGSQFCPGLGISFLCAELELLGGTGSKSRAVGVSEGSPRSRSRARSEICRKFTLLLAIISITGCMTTPGRWRNFSKLRRVSRTALMLSERSPVLQRRLGQWDEAIAEQRRLVELDPRSIHASVESRN